MKRNSVRLSFISFFLLHHRFFLFGEYDAIWCVYFHRLFGLPLMRKINEMTHRRFFSYKNK